VPAALVAPLLLALLRPPTCSPVVVELPRSLLSASCTSLFLGISLLHFPTPRRQPSCTSPLLGVILLALPCFLTWALYCAKCHSVLLSVTLSAPYPQSGVTDNDVWRGLRIALGNCHPGPGGLCSMLPIPAGHSDLDVDANYTALTPRPRLLSPSCAHLIALSEHHSPPVCRSSLGSAGHRPVTSKSSIAPPPSSLRCGGARERAPSEDSLGEMEGTKPNPKCIQIWKKEDRKGVKVVCICHWLSPLSCNKKELFIHGAKFPSHTLALP